MGDNVVLPSAAATIATDEVDTGSGPAQVQYGKIISAADGSVNRLYVSPGGGMHVAAWHYAWETPFGIAVASPSYADGKIVGDVFDLGEAPEGMLLDYRASIGCLDGATTPPPLHLLVIPADVAVVDGTDFGVDGGDPVWSNTFDAFDSLQITGSEFTIETIGSPFFRSALSPPGFRKPFNRHSILGDIAGNVHVWGMLIADGAVTDDLTAGLAVSVTARACYPDRLTPY